jgi:hypothetical protein
MIDSFHGAVLLSGLASSQTIRKTGKAMFFMDHADQQPDQLKKMP